MNVISRIKFFCLGKLCKKILFNFILIFCYKKIVLKWPHKKYLKALLLVFKNHLKNILFLFFHIKEVKKCI